MADELVPTTQPGEQPPAPVEPLASGGETPPAPVDTAPPLPETTPVVEDVVPPSLPGQMNQEAEAGWLRQQVASMAQQLQQAQANLREYETAGLSDEERARQQLAWQQQQLEQQYQSIQEQQARKQWSEYYRQWVPAKPDLVQGDDPVVWGHNVLTHLYQENARLQRELAAVKKAATAPAAPKVTSQTPGPSHRQTLSQLKYEDFERIRDQVRYGNLSPDEYPVIG